MTYKVDNIKMYYLENILLEEEYTELCRLEAVLLDENLPPVVERMKEIE